MSKVLPKPYSERFVLFRRRFTKKGPTRNTSVKHCLGIAFLIHIVILLLRVATLLTTAPTSFLITVLLLNAFFISGLSCISSRLFTSLSELRSICRLFVHEAIVFLNIFLTNRWRFKLSLNISLSFNHRERSSLPAETFKSFDLL